MTSDAKLAAALSLKKPLPAHSWPKRLHRWLGLSLGLVYLLMGLSGVALVFKDELLSWQYPPLAGAPAAGVPLDQWLTRVEGEYRGIRSIRLPQDGAAYFQVFLKTGERHYLDAAGQRLLTRRARGDALAWLEEFHHRLLAGEAGEWLLGVLAIGTLTLLGLGLWLWWPQAGRWKTALRLDWSAGGLRRWFDAHRVVAAVAAVLLVYNVVTGLMMTMHGAPLGLLTAWDAAPPPAPPKLLAAPVSSRLPWERLLAEARKAMPEARLTMVTPPSDPDKPLMLRMRQPGEWHPNGRGGLALDPGTGEVLWAVDVRELNAGTRLAYAQFPLHAGKLGSPVVTGLTVLAGLVPVFLALSGLRLWWLRRRVRRR
ncbi:MAG: PepSY domain-containing protein [Gammaproteobacteria bacterium]|nr:PepSY domain-containing protein [Gammaproteobacteria bacterium]